MIKIFITSAGGYIRVMLARELLSKEYFFNTYGFFTYGNVFENHNNLKFVRSDIKNKT